MHIKPSLLLLLAVLSGALMGLPANAGAPKAPTVEGLNAEQLVFFMVGKGRGSDKDSGQNGRIYFSVKIIGGPQPYANIMLANCDPTPPGEVGKAWGHPEFETIKRALSADDIKYLDSFLKRYYGQEPVTDQKLFYARGTKFFGLESTPDAKLKLALPGDFFKEDPKLDAEFITQFLGVNW